MTCHHQLANLDKVLTYRHFGRLPELLRAWGSSGRLWPSISELIGQQAEELLALPEAERYARFFEHFIDGLRARALTLEILAAEVQHRNELTAILETEREGRDQIKASIRGTAYHLIGAAAAGSAQHMAREHP